MFVEWNSAPRDKGEGPSGRTCISPDGYKLAVYDADRSMLFDRNRDPLEMNNLYESREGAAVRKRLRGRIEEWRKRTGDRLPLPD